MKRVLAGCGVVLAGIVLLVIGAYVVHGLVGMGEVREAKARAVQDATDGLPDAERQAVGQQHALRSRVGLGEPTYSWRELQCTFQTRDAGWIVQDYEQVCDVRTVDLFAVAAPRSGSCRSRHLPIEDPLFGVASITRGPATSLQQEHTWEWSCPALLRSPLDVSRVLSGHRPDDLADSPAWVIAETRTSVSSTLIGCSAWGVVFCNAPYDQPVLPG